MKVYKLDKLVAMNTEYNMESYRAFVVEEIGTDDTAEVTAKIDAKKVGAILTELAALRKVQSNLGGPLPLGPHFLVIPPNKTFEFTGTATKFVRLIGKIIELAVGETLPGDYLSRFAAQHNEYVTCLEGTDVDSTTSWADKGEVTLETLTPSTIEQYLFKNRFYVNQVAAGDTAEAEGDVGVRLYLDGVPFDHLLAATGRRGLARMSLEIPETTKDKAHEPFTLEDSPITVPGDKTLDVKAMNVSGGVLFATTEASFHWYGVAVYKKAA